MLSSFRFPRVRGGFELKKLVEVTVGIGAGTGHSRGGGGRREVVAEGWQEGDRPGTRIENSSHFVADDG